jgi:hypothetical protein
MFASATLNNAMLRLSSAAYGVIQNFLMIAGLVFVIGFVGLLTGNAGLIEGMKAVLPAHGALTTEDKLTDSSGDVLPTSLQLSPGLIGVLDYVSRRYHVSTEALQPIFASAQTIGHELELDPLLIIAVIGIESRFNPFSQSVVGAQGLMQVVPRFHKDKLPEEAERTTFLDPVTNVQVGARVLKESILRNGGLEEGLQQFGGATGDPERKYAGKVMAEKLRLEQAALRLSSS